MLCLTGCETQTELPNATGTLPTRSVEEKDREKETLDAWEREPVSTEKIKPPLSETGVTLDFTDKEGPVCTVEFKQKMEPYIRDAIQGYRLADESASAFLEIQYVHGGDAEILVPGLADNYAADIIHVEDFGSISFGERLEARKVISRGRNEIQYEAYAIAIETGAITILIGFPAKTEDTNGVLLREAAGTFDYEYDIK